MTRPHLEEFARQAVERLARTDPELYAILQREHERQETVLTMVASCCVTDPASLGAEAMVPMNVTAEGYPGARYHAGCENVDDIEQLAIDRAKQAFGARYANVQPHSATTANQMVMCSLMKAGETILGMELDYGGHLTHGSKPNFSGQYFNSIGYGLTPDGEIDFERVRKLAHEHRPTLIICGFTAYPRQVDFPRFREIADEVGAYLLADITHIAGLVVAGEHPSPIDHAHFTTTCTHKQLYGARAGMIMMGKDWQALAPDGKRTLETMIQRAVFPFFSGAPNLNAIASTASMLGRVMKPEFKELARRIRADARAVAKGFAERGYDVATGGTDNHIVVIDVLARGNTGVNAEKALEACGIIVNKNRIPGDTKPATIASGIRIGTNSLALRELGPDEMPLCVDLIDRVLSATKSTGDRTYELDPAVQAAVRQEVRDICARFPIPTWQAADQGVATA